jgi:hypothetical protein
MVDDKEYGKFKLESLIDEGVFLQPKFYAEREQDGHVTLRAKGIPKEIMETLSFEDYKAWLEIIKEGTQTRIDVFKGLKSRTKFISALKANDDLERVREMKKSINLVLEQKRIVDYNENTTRPHERHDYGEKAGYMTENGKDVFKKVLESYVDDLDYLKEWISEYGYIAIPAKDARTMKTGYSANPSGASLWSRTDWEERAQAKSRRNRQLIPSKPGFIRRQARSHGV